MPENPSSDGEVTAPSSQSVRDTPENKMKRKKHPGRYIKSVHATDAKRVDRIVDGTDSGSATDSPTRSAAKSSNSKLLSHQEETTSSEGDEKRRPLRVDMGPSAQGRRLPATTVGEQAASYKNYIDLYSS